MFHCFPGIPQQLLKGFCSKSFFGSLFRIQIAFSHGYNILGGPVAIPASKSLFNLKWNGSTVPWPLTRIPNSVFMGKSTRVSDLGSSAHIRVSLFEQNHGDLLSEGTFQTPSCGFLDLECWLLLSLPALLLTGFPWHSIIPRRSS